MYDLMQRIEGLTAELHNTVKQMARHGKDRSEAEHDYRIAVQQETLKLRDEGVPATLIEKIVNGITADKRQERDIQDVFYKTAQEKINALKKEIEVTNDQINREWSRHE